MSKSRMNPLIEARELGEVLSLENIDKEVARRIVTGYSYCLYWKPRADAYRKRWVRAAMQGFISNEELK